MTLDRVVVGSYEANCYILSLESQTLVIDPGDEFSKIEPYLKGKQVIGVLVTHGHSDHVGALGNFDEEKVYDFYNLNIGQNEIGPFTFEAIYTPGHTDDSLTYYFAGEGMMFTGDFLFKGTVGRTDFPAGNKASMRNSLKKISKYPDAHVYPGHGKDTTLEHEKQNNIYFSEI